MKKLLTLFFLIFSITFAIPDFEELKWGFTIDAIKGFHPNLEQKFSPGEGVTKYEYYPKNSNIGKISFYLFENKLYKIISEFDPTKVKPKDVGNIADKYIKNWGNPTSDIIEEEYSDFTIKGNKQTWITRNTYISLIGQDYINKDNQIYDSKLLMEYGLIDPAKRKNNSSLNDLILN